MTQAEDEAFRRHAIARLRTEIEKLRNLLHKKNKSLNYLTARDRRRALFEIQGDPKRS